MGVWELRPGSSANSAGKLGPPDGDAACRRRHNRTLIPRAQFDYMRVLGASELRIVWEVVVLGTLDKALGGATN